MRSVIEKIKLKLASFMGGVTVTSYADELKIADGNRQLLGLPSIYSQFKLLGAPSLVSKAGVLAQELNQYARDAFFQPGNCLIFHYQYLSFIQKNIDPCATLTVGYVDIDGEAKFKFPRKNLKTWYENGVLSSKDSWCLNVHVWITLSNLEVIDLTLIFDIFRIIFPGEKLDAYPFVFGARDIDNDRIIYHPVIIGNDYVRTMLTGSKNKNHL